MNIVLPSSSFEKIIRLCSLIVYSPDLGKSLFVCTNFLRETSSITSTFSLSINAIDGINSILLFFVILNEYVFLF
jgi:hypothetical protein